MPDNEKEGKDKVVKMMKKENADRKGSVVKDVAGRKLVCMVVVRGCRI